MKAGSPYQLLVVDDEPQIRRLLDIALRAEGYQVILATNGEEGLGMAAMRSPDLVILDIGLPGMDGHEVLRNLREWSDVPVLMLSVRDTEAEKVKALDKGANDYVTKPFGTQELMARVRALLRQKAKPVDGGAMLRFDDGRLSIDLARREVLVDGVAISLTRKEFAFLALLIRHEGRIVTQQQILTELWGGSHVADTHYLRIVVGKLRQKLGDSPTDPTWIRTDPGVGYRFTRQPSVGR